MREFIVRTIINALAIMFILPAVTTISFAGQFWPEAIIAGLLFAVITAVTDWVLGRFVIFTLGLGAILWLFFWWLIPAINISVLAGLFPEVVIVPGFGTAILGGLVFMVINWATRGLVARASKD